MKTSNVCIVCVCALACGLLSFSGCGGTADEEKPLDEVKKEAEKMDAGQLRKKALEYKDAITAKTGEIDKLKEKLDEIPLAEKLGDEAKKLKGEVEELTKSLKSLKDRFEVYYDQLKKKEGDLSGLDI